MTQPISDDEWITQCLTNRESYYATQANRRASTNCRWCRPHSEHGFTCKDCPCDSSYTSRDDSWREPNKPPDWLIRQFAHDHGLDGYAARALHTPAGPSPTRRARIKHLLVFGEGHP